MAIRRSLTNYDYWCSGIPLHAATRHFATTEERAVLDSPPIELEAPDPPDLAKSETPFLDALVSIGDIASLNNRDRVAERKRIERLYALELEIKDRILDDLYNQDVFGFGYLTTTKRARSPSLIPCDFFDDPEIDWDRGVGSAHGREYDSIRLLHYENYKRPTNKKMGRPSAREAINAAIGELNETGSKFWSMDRWRQVRRLRQRIIELRPDLKESQKGLSNETLSRYLFAFENLISGK